MFHAHSLVLIQLFLHATSVSLSVSASNVKFLFVSRKTIAHGERFGENNEKSLSHFYLKGTNTNVYVQHCSTGDLCH